MIFSRFSKFALIFAMFFIFAPIFADESFLADRYTIGTNYGTRSRPDDVFYTIEKGNVILYIGTSLEFLQFKARLKKADGEEVWFDLYNNDHNYSHYGFPSSGPVGNYYAKPVLQETVTLRFQNDDVFLYQLVADFLDDLDRFSYEVDPDYFKRYVLPHVETRYLRYLRNSIFALYDYKFSSKELRDFFSQFAWYAYDESMTLDKINQRMPEKFMRLVKYIKAEEEKRK